MREKKKIEKLKKKKRKRFASVGLFWDFFFLHSVQILSDPLHLGCHADCISLFKGSSPTGYGIG